uniref:E3 ubiquitin-protein ligase RNF180 n=2 Tax=Cyprinodon TaxID=28741 RepID=A0A3Q2E2K3_CYPVA
MSAHMGTSVIGGTTTNKGNRNEDPSEGHGSNEIHNRWMKEMRPLLRAADHLTEEHLVTPALPLRKAHRKTCPEEKQGRRGERNQERKEERHIRGKERGQDHPRRMKKLCADQAQDATRKGTFESFSTNMQLNSILKTEESSNNLESKHTCSKSQTVGFTQTETSDLHFQCGRPGDLRRFAPLSSRASSSRDSDSFLAEVKRGAGSERTLQGYSSQTHISDSENEGDEDGNEDTIEEGEEEGSGVVEVTGRGMYSTESPPCIPSEERRISKREKSRIKSLRRRQRRRERWKQSQQQESSQSSQATPSTSSSTEDEEALSMRNKEGLVCAVCLDVYFNPYMCLPCNHIFCEPCLRTLAKNSPTNTPCPLCRTIITHVFFQKDLNQTAKTFFPKDYLSRKQNFQRAPCSKWPLPSCRRLFQIFRGFQRQSNPIVRRQFPHGGGFPLDALDFEDEPRSWRFDMDMVIIYIYSVNWVVGFFIFCFLCYLFFPSF